MSQAETKDARLLSLRNSAVPFTTTLFWFEITLKVLKTVVT